MKFTTTLCWNCQNFTKCSWSRGIPVKNWVAIPSRKNSYKVIDCPQFLEDKIWGVTKPELVDILEIAKSKLDKISEAKLANLLLQKGYKFCFRDSGTKTYYIERINKTKGAK